MCNGYFYNSVANLTLKNVEYVHGDVALNFYYVGLHVYSMYNKNADLEDFSSQETTSSWCVLGDSQT